MSGPYSPEEIETRLREAARTLEALPDHIFPQQFVSAWPDTVRGQLGEPVEDADAFSPTPKQVDECFEALDWLKYLSKRDQGIVWAWANGAAWWSLTQGYHTSESIVQRWFDDAIERICAGLNKPRKPVLSNRAVGGRCCGAGRFPLK